jgi:hypothetical protein
MEFKKDAEITTSDFWYDLFEGGYIKPEEVLVSEEDIKEVKAARAVLMKFFRAAEDKDIINYL